MESIDRQEIGRSEREKETADGQSGGCCDRETGGEAETAGTGRSWHLQLDTDVRRTAWVKGSGRLFPLTP